MDIMADYEQHLVDSKKALEDWKSYNPKDNYDLDLKKSKILKYEIYSTDEYYHYVRRKKEDYFLKFSKVPAPMQEFFKTNNRFYIILDSVYYLDEGRLHQIKKWKLLAAYKDSTLISFKIERKDLIPYIGSRRCAVIDVPKKIPAHPIFENCIDVDSARSPGCVERNPLRDETIAKLELMQ